MTTRRTWMAGASAVFAAAISRPAWARPVWVQAQAGAAEAKLPPAPTPAQWAKSPAFENITLSPDGTQLAYIVEKPTTKLLYHIDLKTKQSQAFDIGATKVHETGWIGNDHIAVTRSFALSRGAFMGLRSNRALATVYNIRDKSLVSLFKEKIGGKNPGAGTAIGNWGGMLKPVTANGTLYILADSYDEDDHCNLVRFVLDENRCEIIDSGGLEVQRWVTGPDGRLIARVEYFVDKKHWVLSYRDNGGWRPILSRDTDTDIPDVLGLSRDGKSLLVFMYDAAEQGQYFDVDPSGKLSPPLDTPGVDPVMLFDPVTECHSGYLTEDDTGLIYTYFDPAMQDLVGKAQKAVQDYRMVIAGRANDPHKMIIYSEGDDDAGTYYLIDFATNAAQAIGSCYPDIPVEWLTGKHAMSYKAGDGLEIPAFLTLPPNREARNLPLVVLPHGGPFAHDDITLDTQSQTFAAQGYAVLQPNFRGSDGYGADFLKAGYGQWGGKMQSDLSDGVKALAAKGTIDAKRVAIVGFSYGGYAALAGATIDQGIYNCAASISGVSDVTAWLELQRDYLAEVDSVGYNYMKRYLGGVDTARISPINLAAKASIPILIIHGRDDSRVPFKQSETMASALKGAGKDVTFVPLVHTDHNESNEAERVTLMETLVAFVQKHNPA